jgi:hypothetical protein
VKINNCPTGLGGAYFIDQFFYVDLKHMYDIIGDIHGHAHPLKQLLKKMGYSKVNGVYQHPGRQVIFTGDYIDRGPAIRETLQIVKSMVDHGHAKAILGNHEYNAAAYAYKKKPGGKYLRKRNKKNKGQHQATLDQFKGHKAEWKEWIQWFYTLPLYVDLGELRVVHACWDQDHINWLQKNKHDSLSGKLLESSHKKKTRPWKVIEETLKGKEVRIPKAYEWKDKDGNPRTSNRVKWWIHPGPGITKGDFLFNCPDGLCREPFDTVSDIVAYPREAPPVFVGHYWLKDESPSIQSQNVICLDYSIAKGGSLVAYQWNTGAKLDNENFVWVRDDN